MSIVTNVKVLTWLQICTIAVAMIVAWLYFTPKQTAARGMIDGIIFCAEDSSVLVDGQVLRVGSSMYGVEVITIGRHKVTFEGNGHRWEQRVRERPNQHWEPPDSQTEPSTSNF